MKHSVHINKSGIIIQKEANSFRKELVRKSIHLATAFVPILLEHFRTIVLCALTIVLICYCIAEILRTRGKKVIIFSFFTEVAARKRDENKFVLGPVTLALGVLLSALFFNEKSAAIAIYALAFGDGLSSLAGKMFGKHLLPLCGGKTIEGSIVCFVAIVLSTFCIIRDLRISLYIAIIGTIIEALPINDFDNIIIPIVIAFIAQYYFHI